MATVARLRNRFPELHDPPSDDICYATQNRQLAVRDIAPDCDLVLVVGSANSSNAVRLVEVALEAGVRASHLIDTADGIDLSWLDDIHTVGLTSGASTPEVLVRGVLARLAEHGFTDVHQVGTVRERTRFALPRDLHRHRRPANVSVPALR
jgi:4-hydroxy-3-methylbut-2-enyl diphosphate reductase